MAHLLGWGSTQAGDSKKRLYNRRYMASGELTVPFMPFRCVFPLYTRQWGASTYSTVYCPSIRQGPNAILPGAGAGWAAAAIPQGPAPAMSMAHKPRTVSPRFIRFRRMCLPLASRVGNPPNPSEDVRPPHGTNPT
jgi:hypothetical protein